MSWRTKASRDWLASLPGVREQVPLAALTSLGVGGPAEFLVQADSVERLIQILDGAHQRGVPVVVLGAGTNLLVSDRGVEGLTLRCEARGHHIEGHQVRAEAGLKMMRLARICARAGLGGLEWAVGLPGTVGGAVYQNAGCWGFETKDRLLSVLAWQPGAGARIWAAGELELGYRTSGLSQGRLPGAVVLEATFALIPSLPEASLARISELTRRRRASQPLAQRSCGSVFKNPPGDSAGRLVEEAGMKGATEGAAEVSPHHANFIVNQGGASAADIDRLIRRVALAVRERSGARLECEVQRVGRWD